MKNKKQKETVTSTIENLPKEIRDRIVYVGDASIGKDLNEIKNSSSNTVYNRENINPINGFSNHSNVNSTAKPHEPFPSLSTNSIQVPEPKEEKTVEEDISVTINFGTSGGKIKTQLKAQGFKFDKDFIKGCEEIRCDLLALLNVNILTIKQGQKAFAKLNTKISENVIEETFGAIKVKPKKIFINNKEVK